MHLHYENGVDRIYVYTEDQERLMNQAVVKYWQNPEYIQFKVMYDGQVGTMIIVSKDFLEIKEDHQACLEKVKKIIDLPLLDGYTLAS